MLQYYKIEKTEKGRIFFYENIGYYNFWDEYLIAHTNTSNKKIFWVLVNRTGREFGNAIATEEQKSDIRNEFADSVYSKEPKEMFNDFQELEEYSYMKMYSKLEQIKN